MLLPKSLLFCFIYPFSWQAIQFYTKKLLLKMHVTSFPKSLDIKAKSALILQLQQPLN